MPLFLLPYFYLQLAMTSCANLRTVSSNLDE
jgi:hypothetical protein